MNTPQIIAFIIAGIAFFVFGYRYVKKIESEYKKIVINCHIEPTEIGFSAYAKEAEGVFGVGGTIQEVKDSFEEAFAFHLNYTQGIYADLQLSDFEITYVEE